MECDFGACLLFVILLALPMKLLASSDIQGTFISHSSSLNVTNVPQRSQHSLMVKDKGTTPDHPLKTTLSLSQQKSYIICNETNIGAVDFQNCYCSSRRNCSTIIQVPSYESCLSSKFKCFPCDCKRPQCDVYGPCCMNMTRRDEFGWLQQNATKTIKETSLQEHPKLITMCDEESVPGVSFLYIRSCPTDCSDQHVRSMCVDDIPTQGQTTESFARAHDNKTGVIYYNRYCAQCNNVSMHTVWDVAVGCDHYMRMYSAMNQEEFLRLSLKVGSSCQVEQILPGALTVFPCQIGRYGDIVGSCNVTVKSYTRDKNVIKECEDNPDLTNLQVRVSERHTRQSYLQNIFCALCNSEFTSLFAYTCSFQNKAQKCCFMASVFDDYPRAILSSPRSKILPFSLLLGSIADKLNPKPPDSGMQFRKCAISEWASPDNRCLRMQCSPGKFLSEGKCLTAINNITGLGYRAQILYIPYNIRRKDPLLPSSPRHATDTYELLNLFLNYLNNQTFLDRTIAETQLHVTYVWREGTYNVNVSQVGSQPTMNTTMNNLKMDSPIKNHELFFYVDAYIIASKSIPRDDLESTILDSLEFGMPLLQLEPNSTMLLAPMIVSELPDISTSSEQQSKDQSQFADVQTVVIHNINRTENILWNYRFEFLMMSRVLTCVHISFNKSEYTFIVNCTIFPPTWQVHLKLGRITLIISDFLELSKLAVYSDNGSNNDHMKVCVDLLEDKLQELRTSQVSLEDSSVFLWQYYLTHVGISMSMVCLLITLLTFSLYSTLRSSAGINNMFLSGTLLLAQASLLSSNHIEGPGPVCTAVGISTHFLWLSVTAWSIICCFHMFRVFTAKTGILKSSAISQRIVLIKKILVSVLLPIFIISAVIVVSYFTSGGQRIGYSDNNPCYLDSSLLATLSFVLPLAIAIAVNVFFFVSTIQKIHKVKKLQVNASFKKKDRETFIIYIKLSTLTGAFWAVAIVSEQADNDPLRFAAIILNGLQGVFLFMSFVCNKRVIRTCFQTLSSQACSSSTNVSVKTAESKDRTLEKSTAF